MCASPASYDFSAPPPKPARPWQRWALIAALAVLLCAVLAAAQTWRWVTSDLPTVPDAQGLWSLNRPPGVTFTDREGHVLVTRGSRHGRAVRLAELPPYVSRAFLAAEDRRFYEHSGIDLQGVARALWVNFQEGRTAQGASTLTQQLVRTIFLTNDRTLRRKAQEAVLARELERRLSKDAILELYLNRVFFGENAYGIDAAATAYFGHGARQLTLAEAALLAALPKAPSRLDPTNDFNAALDRSHLILRLMRQERWINDDELNRALLQPPRLADIEQGEGAMAWVYDLAARQARELAGPNAPDLVVRLTVDPTLQAEAQSILTRAIQREGRPLGATQGALVSLGPDGSIRALIGGTNWRESPFNRAWQAHRQPGSAYKPFVYAAAIERGAHPSDIRVDGPVTLAGWTPQNYGGSFHGPVTIAEALAHSLNTVSAQLASEVGSTRLGDLAHRFGLNDIPDAPGLSVSLGAYEVTPLELAGGFAVFQQGGRRVDPWLIDQVASARGDVLWRHLPSAGIPVYDPRFNAQMVAMMQGVVQRGTGVGAQLGTRPVAGKTGTSQNWRDAWFAGFTADWLTVVWVGDDRGRPMRRVVGGDLPADIWRRFMLQAHQGMPIRPLTGLNPARPGRPEDPAADYRQAFYAQLGDDFRREAMR